MSAKKNLMDPRQLEILATVFTVEQVAHFFELSPTTVRKQMAENDYLRVAYKKGEAEYLGAIASNLKKQALDGNVTAGIFIMKTRGGWRETQNIDIRDERMNFKSMGDFYADHIGTGPALDDEEESRVCH
ncbi:hypothetical protein KAR91_84910 [Candidatus Pacearchaeota archaeon]|nr:hypothetical protein [Candidatus Pacearchaeota archaeon]